MGKKCRRKRIAKRTRFTGTPNQRAFKRLILEVLKRRGG